MEDALLEHRIVSAVTISKLIDDKVSVLRTKFKCKDCKAEAYFSKGSPKQAPYFGARNHLDGCEEARRGSRSDHQQLVEADTLVIPIGGGGSTSEHGHSDVIVKKSLTRTSVSAAHGTANVSATRGVGAVLRLLIDHPEFATSSKHVVVANQAISASEFFVPFLQLENKHEDRLVGAWGTVFDAREGGSIVWLNRGDAKVTIEVPKTIFHELKVIYNFTSARELSGAKFLVVGRFNIHLECRIDDAKQLALLVG